MTTTRRQAAHDSGEDIWGRVAKAGEDGLPPERAIGRNTRSQFERGKTWIRDVKCAAEKKSFVRYRGHYAVTLDPDKCTAYAAERLQSLYRQAVRIYKSSLKELPPESQELLTVTLLTKQLQSIFDAMDILKAAGFSPETAAAKAGATTSAKRSSASSRGRKT
ncbi:MULTISPECIES: hypothetical protein [Streptomyces]|uniref:Transposase n=1 Tax=Streptomyces eurythermus TaxID=42237 RepID=A0ABW6Z522_9ACTN|nr:MULTISPECIES: hypothetical protein [Streptomyces]KOX05299.1 hypothetical protein ADL04_07640 [Streptomyces sp. NRRL B-3648]QIS72380.1 hypothetical protein HB370_22330 [Streptomyces sp. DSM 40868]